MHTCSNSTNRTPIGVWGKRKEESFPHPLICRRTITKISSTALLVIGFLAALSAVLFHPVPARATVVNLSPTQDTFLSENSEASHKSDTTLQTRSPGRIALLQFNLSGIPQGSRIVSAQLRLYSGANIEFRADTATKVYATLGSWPENVGWSGRPPRASTSEDSIAVTATGRSYQWDITDLAQDWVSGIEANFGVTVVSEGGGELYFNSRENSSNKPVLIVEYTAGTPLPTPTPSPTPTPIASPTPTPVPSPTPPPSGSNSVNLIPTQDTYLFENTEASHKSETILQTRFPEKRTALLQFNLSGIPQGSQIVSAQLRLYSGANTSFRADTATKVYATLGSWTEDVGWSGRPPRASTSEDSVAVTATEQSYQWDITDLAQDWVNGVEANFGVTVVSEGGGELYFHSRENSSNKPTLIVEYITGTPLPNLPPVVNLTVSPASGTAPLTVTFNSNASDPDGSIIENRWDFDGNGTIDQITTTNQVSRTYQNPNQYNVTVRAIDNRGASTQDSVIVNVLPAPTPSPTPTPVATPTPTPAPSPTPPPSSSNPWKYTTGRTFDIICVTDQETDSTVRTLAAIGVCHGFLDTWGRPRGNLIKGTLGNTADWVIPYFDFGNGKETNGSIHDRDWFDDVVKAQHPEWILRERTATGCDGRWIRLDESNKISYAMDIGSIGNLGSPINSSKYVDRWANELLSTYQGNNWDGVWADNTHIFDQVANNYCYDNGDGTMSDCGSVIPCNPRTGGNYTETEFNNDLLKGLKRIRSLFEPRGLFFLWQSGGRFWRFYSENTTPMLEDLAREVNMVHIEDFGLDFFAKPHSFNNWKEQTAVVQDILRNNNPTIAIRSAGGKNPTLEAKFFRDASWLLVKEFNMCLRTFTNIGVNSIEPWWLTTDLGNAQGSMFVVSGTEVRRRNYQNGIVLVNPHDTGTYTVNLGGSYINVQTGSSVSSVTLGPKKGVILTR